MKRGRKGQEHKWKAEPKPKTKGTKYPSARPMDLLFQARCTIPCCLHITAQPSLPRMDFCPLVTQCSDIWTIRAANIDLCGATPDSSTPCPAPQSKSHLLHFITEVLAASSAFFLFFFYFLYFCLFLLVFFSANSSLAICWNEQPARASWDGAEHGAEIYVS